MNILPTIKLLPHRQSVWKDLAISSLALLSAGLLIFEFSSDLLSSQLRVLYTIDLVIALLFLKDFIYEISVAKNKKLYFRQNWYLLIAAIPITEGVFQALRSVQLLRLLRVVRLYARIKRLSIASEHISDKSTRYIFIALITTIVIFTSASLFYLFESETNAQLNSFFDAIWWAVVTSTTVGYGDVLPITWQGRIVSMVLMFFGIGLLGTIAGLVGNYFLKEDVSS